MIASSHTIGLTIVTLVISTNLQVFGQEEFGQEDIPNSMTPKVEIGYDDLPKKVRSVIERSEFGKLELENVYEVGKRTGQRQVHYTVRFKNGEAFHDIYLDDEGNVIDPQDSDSKSSTQSPNK